MWKRTLFSILPSDLVLETAIYLSYSFGIEYLLYYGNTYRNTYCITVGCFKGNEYQVNEIQLTKLSFYFLENFSKKIVMSSSVNNSISISEQCIEQY